MKPINELLLAVGLTGAVGLVGVGVFVGLCAISFLIFAGLVALIAWLSGWFVFTWKLAALVWALAAAAKMILK
jgi:hypothetical protein